MAAVAAMNEAQIEYWNGRGGQTWADEQPTLDAIMQPLADLALAAAAARPGERVLDIGCGAGATLLALARAGALVTGCDVSAPLLGCAAARLDEARLSATLIEADAARHPFPHGGADLVFSRFGVMFFDDPAAALANLRRATAPGGRLVFVCWRAMAQSAWFARPLALAAAFLPPAPPTDPHAPGPFAFADATYLRAILERAGWTRIEIAPRDASLRMGETGAAAARLALRVGPLASAARELPAPTGAALLQALTLAFGTGPVNLSGAIWLVSAEP